MALLDDIRVSARVSSTATDSELEMWVSSALADLERVGVRPALLERESLNPLAKAAVTCFVKAHYGYDVDERPQFEEAYRSLAVGLMNSSANIAAGDGE